MQGIRWLKEYALARRKGSATDGKRMMRRLRYIAALLPVFLASASAQADLTAAPPAPGQPQAPAVQPGPQASPDSALAEAIPLGSSLATGLPRPLVAAPEARTSDQAVKQLPPAPSSLALFFSAMGSLGAWRLTRLARKVHLSHLPAWYHEGAPVQIGHAFATDLDFASLPVCSFEPPGSDRPPIPHPARREASPRLAFQCSLPPAAPRGPPPRAS